jgi:hypothetical protein
VRIRKLRRKRPNGNDAACQSRRSLGLYRPGMHKADHEATLKKSLSEQGTDYVNSAMDFLT